MKGRNYALAEGRKVGELFKGMPLDTILANYLFLMVPQQEGRSRVALVAREDRRRVYVAYEDSSIRSLKRGSQGTYDVAGRESVKAFVARARRSLSG